MRGRGAAGTTGVAQMFSQLELKQFEVLGFVVARSAFSAEEMAVVGENFAEVLAEDRRGAAFGGEKRQEVQGFLEQREPLYRLLEDDRLFEGVEQLLGPGFVWIGSDGNLYVGDTRWHVDHRGPYRRLKVTFYLDPVDEGSGCLRVVPGSHLGGFNEAMLAEEWPGWEDDPSQTPFGLKGVELPGYPIVSRPGDVVFWNPKLFHGSFGGATGRRMFSLRFGAKPRAEADFENLRWSYGINLEKARQSSIRQRGEGFTAREGVYSEEFLRSDSPRLRSMTAELVELGFR